MDKTVEIKPYDKTYVGKWVSNTTRKPRLWLKVEYVGKMLLMGLDKTGMEWVELLNYMYEVRDDEEDRNKTE